MIWSCVAAQCVMCFRTAAAQQAERSRVLNEGIVILLVPPMLVIAGVLALAWKKNSAGQRGDPAQNASSDTTSGRPAE